MKGLLKRHKLLTMMISLLTLYRSIDCNAQLTQATDEVYNVIKANENNFPFPQAYDTIEVGVFDPVHSVFNGLHSVTIYSQTRHRNFTTHPVAPSHALRSWLKFTINQRISGTFSVFVNGAEYRSNPGEGVVYADAADLSSAPWRISYGTAEYSDIVQIARKHVIAIGAYRIKYLPLLVCYAPPQNERGSNVCDYSHSTTVGSSFTISHTEGNTRVDSKMIGLKGFIDFINKASSLLAANDPDPGSKAVLAAVNKIGTDVTALIGTQTNSTSYGTTIDSQQVVSDQNVVSGSLKTGNGISNTPGHGDEFVFLGNVMVFWIVIDGKLYYCLMNDDQMVSYRLSANSIRQSADPAQQNILAIDPFCTLDNPDLSGSRFTKIADPLTGAASPIIIDSYSPLAMSMTVQHSESRAGTYSNATTETVDSKPGLLNYFGLGYGSYNTQISYKNSSAHTSSQSEQQVADINITPTKDSIWEVQLYYDNAFGTILVQRVPLQQTGVVSTAVLTDNTGRVLPSQWVHIKIGNLDYSVLTDKTGHFKIYSTTLKAETNSVQLQVGKHVSTIIVSKGLNKEYKVPVTGLPVKGNPLFLNQK